MFLKYYLSGAAFLGLFGAIAQTNEVEDWTRANPSVMLVESNDATPEFLENLKANNVSYIVFEEEFSLSDIAEFEAKNKPIAIDNLDESEATEIKVWLSEHRDVKIIKRSMYDQLDSQKQSVYMDSGALILIGEKITLEDIRNY
jgi:hypothetical protein